MINRAFPVIVVDRTMLASAIFDTTDPKATSRDGRQGTSPFVAPKSNVVRARWLIEFRHGLDIGRSAVCIPRVRDRECEGMKTTVLAFTALTLVVAARSSGGATSHRRSGFARRRAPPTR